MHADPLDRLREICLALSEAHEVEAWGEPTFRVKDKMFAMHARADGHHGDGREGVWCKAKAVTQDMMIRAEPNRYFSPPYMGPKGWVGVWLGRNTDWATLEDLLRDAYRMTAPKRLLTRMDEAADETTSRRKTAGTGARKGANKTATKTATKTARTVPGKKAAAVTRKAMGNAARKTSSTGRIKAATKGASRARKLK